MGDPRAQRGSQRLRHLGIVAQQPAILLQPDDAIVLEREEKRHVPCKKLRRLVLDQPATRFPIQVQHLVGHRPKAARSIAPRTAVDGAALRDAFQKLDVRHEAPSAFIET
ncbi:MAG: hypothetical protein BWX86_02051 [Verrucomicrobia bacterium ADurb.Bin122]|nr:MAG: hypothetical protein BWX86_02051 [Verrucomicrobia bacterium ADurb.Bin122]